MKILIVGMTLLLAMPAFSQTQPVVRFSVTHILPQIVSGPDLETEIVLINNSLEDGTATVSFMDDNGKPLVFPTNEGIHSTLEVALKRHQTKTVLVFRQGGPVVSGWARITSKLVPGAYGAFTQYAGGTNNVLGYAGIPSSPSQPRFAITLHPDHGVALVNPGPTPARITLTVFDLDGRKIAERRLYPNASDDLCPGCHLAKFFSQEPFSFGPQEGKVVFESNVPLSTVALKFKGATLATIPTLEAPPFRDMRVESSSKTVGAAISTASIQTAPSPIEKGDGVVWHRFRFEGGKLTEERMSSSLPNVGIRSWYAASKSDLETVESSRRVGIGYFFPRGRGAQPGVVGHADAGLRRIQAIFNAGLARNIGKKDSFDIARDQQGMPAVAVVEGSGTREKYILKRDDGTEYVDVWAVWKEFDQRIPSDWSHVIIFMETFQIVNGQFVGGGVEFSGGTMNPTAMKGAAFLSAVILPFLVDDPCGDKRKYAGTPIPEFGNQAMPRFVGETFDELREASVHILGHEIGHMFGLMFHSAYGDPLKKDTFKSLMNAYISDGGFYCRTSLTEGILLPSEAAVLFSVPMMNRGDDEDFTPPTTEILSKEFSNGVATVVFTAQDPESGIRSVAVHRWSLQNPPWMVYWREFTPSDQGNITISFPVDKAEGLELFVFNGRGGLSIKKLF